MRVTAFSLILAGAATAQGPAPFEDVPPWHWAYDAVQEVAAAGIFVGYPTSDRELAVSAVTQVYDAFAHAGHPAARGWAERFLTNLPTNWPQPLSRSRLVRFRLENARMETGGDRVVVLAHVVVVLRADGGVRERRAVLRADLHRDTTGRLRVNYAALAAAQPEVFR